MKRESQSAPKSSRKSAAAPADPEQKYHFVGWGLGVPGLPHVLSFADAEQMGASTVELLRAAIRNGNYAPLEAENQEA